MLIGSKTQVSKPQMNQGFYVSSRWVAWEVNMKLFRNLFRKKAANTSFTYVPENLSRDIILTYKK